MIMSTCGLKHRPYRTPFFMPCHGLPVFGSPQEASRTRLKNDVVKGTETAYTIDPIILQVIKKLRTVDEAAIDMHHRGILDISR